MEAIRKQASKLREQVARQQQAVLKQFSGRFSPEVAIAGEAELQCYQNLQKLRTSTKAAKHFQRDIVRGVQGYISVSSKQMEIITKLAEDCCKYGNEYQDSGFPLSRASLDFGTSHNLMEKERESMLRILGDQIFEPLRAMITGAPLEDARHLTYRYERIRQDVEAQTAEVLKRQSKSQEVSASADSPVKAAKLQNAETRLSELKNALSALGREATSAMLSVEAQQQEVTFQRLLMMVDAERSYHQSVAGTLDKLYNEMVHMQHNIDTASKSTILTNVHPPNANENPEFDKSADLPANGQNTKSTIMTNVHPLTANEDPASNKSAALPANGPNSVHFIAEVLHPFDAQAEGELSLSVGDFVVVRQVAAHGWSEGECKGKIGWFPSAYAEQRDKVPASKLIEAQMPPPRP